MSSQLLTSGALLRYLHGNTSEKANLQVIGIKIIDTRADDSSISSKRYRLMLSDGKSTFSSCMLGTQMNKLIETKELQENSIIRIDRVIVNTIDKLSGRFMLMIYELEVLQSISDRIGNPVALPLADILNNGGNVTSLEATDHNQTSTTTVRQGSKTLPTSDDRKNGRNSTNENNRSFSKPSATIDKDRIVDIDTLTPYMTKWTIKARVSNKGQIRTYQNARGPGRLFSCDLVDKSGEIRAAAFNSECDKLHALLEVGKIYYIARASLKPANRQFNSLNNNYEMTFNYDTCIELCETNEEQEIPQIQFNFISISEIANRPPNGVCDVIGVVKSTSELETIVSRASQKEFNKRDLLLVDENASISVTLWGQTAEEFNGSSNPILAFKGIRISDFNGRSLTTIASTMMCQDPTENNRINELRTWFDKEGKSMDLPDLSKGADIGTQQTPFKMLYQINAEGLGLIDKPDYMNIKAVVTLIRKESAVYMMCPEDRCGKKVVDENNGTYRCEKCNKTYTTFKWSYMISAEISDATGSQWISAFRNEAEALLGVTADEFGTYKLNQNEVMLDEIIKKAMNRERVFKLRGKLDQYNNERRIQLTCMRISDMDWLAHGRRLMHEINQMEPMN